MNGNICILECITDIQNPGSESMHSHNRNVDSEGFIMCYKTVGTIKINILNLRTTICTVACKTFPYIGTSTLLNTWINEWAEDFCSFREGLDWYGILKKADIFFLSYCKNKEFYIIVSEESWKLHQCSLEWYISLGDKIQYVKPQVWLDQIWTKSLQYLFSGISYFCIDWSWPEFPPFSKSLFRKGGKFKVKISLYRSKIYQRTDIEEIWSKFD